MYNVDYADRVHRYAIIGLTDVQAREALNITKRTWDSWRSIHEDFRKAWDDVHGEATLQVIGALFKRATGYTYQTHERTSRGKGANRLVTERYSSVHVVPDVAAIQAWLKMSPPTMGNITPTNDASKQAAVTFIIDADTLALTGAANAETMRDITPTQ